MKRVVQLLSSVAIVFLALVATQSQRIDSSVLNELSFRNVGPAGMSGRITAIDVDLTRPHHIYAGAASGGVWRSTDGGLAWEPIFNVEHTQSVGAVKINQHNPLEIWVGTGEGNPRNSQNSGRGIYKTMDGGKTWTCMGLEASRVIHRILIDPYDSETVYVGAQGAAWGPNETRGVFKTTNGGKTWEKILYVNDRTGVADMVMDPANHKKLLVALWEFARTPWDFTSGGPGSGLHITYDGGDTWKRLDEQDGMPKGELGRMGLAFAQNKPNIAYALIEAKENGLYKSVDGGASWKLVSKKNIGNRPFYYAELYVDPSNENRIWNLHTYVTKSEDGGKTFETILDYGKGVHPDHHAFWQSPDDPLYLIDGNDGGLNISRDGGKNWRFVTNIPVGQFYHVNYDNDFPYNLYGGMQDNGSWVGPAYVLKNGGIRNADWREVLFGDGFDMMPKRDNNRYGWGMSQGGNLSFYDRETGNNQYARPVHPERVRLRFNWNAAIAQDPFDDRSLYYGSQFVHYSENCGKSWTILSPDLTTNDTSKQHQEKSGGLTVDATQAENHTTILVIAPSPHNDQVIWVGTDDGRLHITQDGGANWESLESRLPGFPAGAWIPQIELSPNTEGEAFVVVNNYRRNDWAPYLYHTSDFGGSFVRIADESNIDGFICSVVQDAEEPNLMFLGADDGLYFSLNAGAEWQKWPSKSFPSVQVRDMKIHPREGDLVLGTFGRAFWVLDDVRPLRRLAATSGEVLENEFAMFEAPDAYLALYRSVDGIRFTADAEFRGDNRSRGANFTLWNKGESKDSDPVSTEEPKDIAMGGDEGAPAEKTKKKRPSKITFYVLDELRDTIRTFTRKPKEGFNQLSWNMRRDGVRFPSRDDPPADADTPSGRTVLPGSYTLVGVFGEWKDSTVIKVHLDPRLDIDEQVLIQQDEAVQEYEQMMRRAYMGFEQLKEARKTVGMVNSAIGNAPDSTQKHVKKIGRELVEKIDELELLYMHPRDLKGIHGATPNLSRTLRQASGYLRRGYGPVDQNGHFAVENAKQELEHTIEKINAFVDESWQGYVDEIEAVHFNLIKSVNKVE